MQLEMVKLKDWETQELGNLSDNLLRFVCFKICPMSPAGEKNVAAVASTPKPLGIFLQMG